MLSKLALVQVEFVRKVASTGRGHVHAPKPTRTTQPSSANDEALWLRVAVRPPATEITITIEGDFRVGGHRVMPSIIE